MERQLSLEDLVDFLPELGPLVADDSVTEIMVNGAGSLYVERGGKLARVEGVSETLTAAALRSAAMQITRPLGFDLLRESPIVDARLEDGSRVAVAYPPATPEVAITIRRFGRKFLTADDLVRMGSLPRSTLEAMASVASRDGNILIAGGTGSGKTTLLNAVVGLLPREDRIVVIEDTMEIRCNHPNCVRLEARGAAGGGVAVRDLVKHTLRHRPDHIVIGEVRGAEAGDVLQALNTGHGGSMTTIHANTCEGALSRMANCAMQAGDGLPWDVTCGNVAQAFSMVVRQARVGGVRGVREVMYVDGYDAGTRRWLLREAWRSPRAAELGTDSPAWRPVEGLRGVKAGPREEVTVASLLLALGGSSAGKLWRVRRRRTRGNGSHGLAAVPVVRPQRAAVARNGDGTAGGGEDA